MVILRKISSKIVVEDRWSIKDAAPEQDTFLGGTSDWTYVIGDRDSSGNWDVVIVRKTRT